MPRNRPPEQLRVDAALLKAVPLFSALPEESLGQLATRVRRRRFGARVSLFHQGDPGETLYVVIAGGVHLLTVSTGGQETHLARRGPGEAFGELSLLDGRPRMADAVTTEPTDLLILRRDDFIRCVTESPQTAMGVMTYLGERLREAGAQHTSRQVHDVLGRVCELLLALVDRHGVEDPAGGRRIAVRVSQRHMARQIGTTRESVNRAFANLKRVNALRVEGRQFIILSPGTLRRYAGGR